jgi:two-component system CheB/CheR fusion protein
LGLGRLQGGLEAFKRLIKAIPEDSGVAYILVQHLEPSHESMLVDILQKITHIPVQEITNNLRVEPDHIYVIPSNCLLMANDGRLELSPRPPKKEKNMPIDVFFTSLAEVHQNHAIGIVLSGTATDGTLGLKMIKEHGGYTFAQEQRSAAFDGMPQSAIDSGVVDFILAPEEIPLQLAKLFQQSGHGQSFEGEEIHRVKEDAFRQLLVLVRLRKGTDFTYYKQTTIRRRVLRRMGLNKIGNIVDYLSYFRENAAEQDLLYQDLLIPVTAFFRDPKTYEVVSGLIFPAMLKDKSQMNPLRIWIAGCSTGEEPYSMAICLNEYLGNKIEDYKIQIFATDIWEGLIAKARSGVYSERDMKGLSAERIEKYFIPVNGGFQIVKSIRDLCLFARHNFLKDPPYAKMDFVSCRNVLIYMESFLQKRALTAFHYALNDLGYLLLGHSETTAPAAELFTVYEKSDKIYTRRSVPGKFLHITSDLVEDRVKDRVYSIKTETGRDSFQKNADEVVLSKFNPPGVVVDEQLEIVQFRGMMGMWLEPSPGKPSLNILKMAMKGLSFELRNALNKAKGSQMPVSKDNIALRSTGREQLVTIEVIPLLNTAEPHYLILFRNTGTASGIVAGVEEDAPEVKGANKEQAESSRNELLEKEMAQLREDMRSIMENQEAVNGELQGANEELLSGSEELQSLNEELETSKEELQSTNEELTTLNQELFDRNEQLNVSWRYAESIVATIREPILILDKDMHVRTANLSYYKKFGTTERETEGRSFLQLGSGQWDLPAIRSMLDNVLSRDGQITDFETRYRFDGSEERGLSLNACRIVRMDSAEVLILLAVEDITEARNQADSLALFSRELERKVQERTDSLSESNQALKQSNDNLEQFATIASHDLQEPLRKILTFSSLLHKRHSKDIDGEAAVLISKISVSAQRMSILIRDVLNFSKVLDASVFVKVNLNMILTNVIDDFDLLIEQKGALVTHDELPVILAVPLQMNQLFYNLLGNALKFSTPGVVPEVDISCRSFPPDEIASYPELNAHTAYCEIVFTDNGIGIDEKFLQQVFLIFQRLNAREHFEGTGIGLALCKRIVLSHKGEIFIVSKKGMGSAFHVILPW